MATKVIKDDIIRVRVTKEQKEKLLSFGYTEEQMDFLNGIIDVKFFRGKPSKIVLKDKTELYL